VPIIIRSARPFGSRAVARCYVKNEGDKILTSVKLRPRWAHHLGDGDGRTTLAPGATREAERRLSRKVSPTAGSVSAVDYSRRAGQVFSAYAAGLTGTF